MYNVLYSESSLSKDQRDSDSDNWEEKEASRTHSVKFTDDVSEAKEVRLCCCYTFRRSRRTYTPISTPLFGRSTRFWHLGHAFRAQSGFGNIGRHVVYSFRKSRAWLRNNVWDKCTKHNAYSVMSTFFVVLE